MSNVIHAPLSVYTSIIVSPVIIDVIYHLTVSLSFITTSYTLLTVIINYL